MKKAKRILALAGVFLLAALYLGTLVLAIFSSPATKWMLMTALGCTIVIPCLIYGMMLIARVLDKRNNHPDREE